MPFVFAHGFSLVCRYEQTKAPVYISRNSFRQLLELIPFDLKIPMPMPEQNKRSFYHDYRSRCIYMITLKKKPGISNFGEIAGDCRIPPGQPGCAYVDLSPLGHQIRKAIWNLPLFELGVKVYQYAIMPDHVHIVLFIQQERKEPLGTIVAHFKRRFDKFFSEGYNDQILHPKRSLDVLIRYVKENPHRLAVRKFRPDYFRRVRHFAINGMEVEAYGNFFLLKHAVIEPVVVHRAWTHQELDKNRKHWLFIAKSGGILVSPFISKAEKEVRAAAIEAGGRIIEIRPEPMGERFKPIGGSFQLCEEGRLLIVAPVGGADLTRKRCLDLNAVAATIAAYPSLVPMPTQGRRG